MSHQLWLTIIQFHTLALILPLSAALLFKRPKLWNTMFSLFLGLLVAYIDLHSDEVQFTALLLLAFGFFLGFAEPTRAWKQALLLGVWVPLAQLTRTVFENQGTLLPEGVGSLPALLFSFAGTYSGVLVQRFEKQSKLETNKQP